MARPTFAARSWTLLLALLFVGGDFGLATLDGLLNHLGRVDTTAAASHIEGNRGCGVHAESCVIATLVAQRQHANLVVAAGPTTQVAETWCDPRQPALVAPAAADPRSHQPRAPPTDLAL